MELDVCIPFKRPTPVEGMFPLDLQRWSRARHLDVMVVKKEGFSHNGRHIPDQTGKFHFTGLTPT